MIASRIRQALGPGWRRLWAIGLGVPLVLGLILASGAAISWLTGSEYERPAEIDAGPVDATQVASPRYFEDDRVWLVRLEAGEFLALYDRAIESAGCPLQWQNDHRFLDRTGWFIDACTGSPYDLTGRCFSEACRGRALGRFSVSTDGGNVVVDLRVLDRDLLADPSADPVNPPDE
jgi:hypothetical protein